MASKKPMKDVIILLPGILGSVLQRSGRDVWALSGGAIVRGLLSLGKNIQDLELDGDDPEVDDLGDGITADRLVDDVHLIPGFWKIDGYSTIRKRLLSEYHLVPGKNWYEFPYDWRRDNRVAAKRLAQVAPHWLARWRETSGAQDAKLVLLAHSMGGLVSRYYLEVLGGWRDTRAIVTFGTPFRGSLNALDFLANGFRKGFGPFKLNLTKMLRSLTSIYQLLPIYPCVTSGASIAHIGNASGLPTDIDLDRVNAAKQFHDTIAQAVDQNGGPGRYEIHPIVGIFQPTYQSAVIEADKLKMIRTYEDEDMGGDGTVPRVSATPIELSDDPREMYATQKHGALQNAASILGQVIGVLSRKPLGRFRESPFDGFSLDMDDLFALDESVVFRIQTDGPATGVVATVENVDTHETVRLERIDLVDGVAMGELGSLPLGVYRIKVSDTDGVGMRPISDVFMVADETTEI